MTLALERARSGRPVLHPRLCAGVVAVSSTVHVLLAVQNQHGAWLSALMVVLAGVCLPCVLHIWRNSHVAALQRVMACALFMVALHGVLLVGSAAGGHAHGSGHSVAGTAVDQAGSLLAVIGLELITALLAAALVARLRRGRHDARIRRVNEEQDADSPSAPRGVSFAVYRAADLNAPQPDIPFIAFLVQKSR